MNENNKVEVGKAFRHYGALGGRMVLQAFYNYVSEHLKGSTEEVAKTFLELEAVLTKVVAELEK